MSQLRYRSDIDGLRAVAVLGVVIYHAFPWVVPGGFTGVDIFFVISGYLISGILYKGHRESNFSFKEFYARRIRRLFPALITVLLLCLGYGWLVLLPDEYQQLGKHVAAGTLFIQNIVFWKESGYFDIAANLKPMLHLWSLAVEEQFYIFFPPLLVLLWKRPRVLIPAMIVLLVGTFIANVVMSYQAVVTDFFLTPYRAWEFLGGSLLAWWHYDKGHEEEVPLYREALSWTGLLLLGFAMFWIHPGDSHPGWNACASKGNPYPGWRALLPVAGTLLLMEGGKGAWVNRKILSHPAMVWVGLISYPLYLFHWPALSFVHIVKGGNPSAGLIWTALGVALLLTLLTYYFIEKKLRHNKGAWVIPTLVGVFLVTGLTAAAVWKGAIRPRLDSRELQEYARAAEEHNYFDGYSTERFSKDIWIHEAGPDGPKTLFIGDSHAQQCAPRIMKLIHEGSCENRRAAFLTMGLVLPIPGADGLLPAAQKDMSRGIEKIGTDPKTDRIVVAANWKYFFGVGGGKYRVEGKSLSSAEGTDAAIVKLMDHLQEFVQAGKKVYLLLSIPTSPAFDPKSIVERNFDGSFSISRHDPQLAELMNERAGVLSHGAIMQRFAEEAAKRGINIIDPVPDLSNGGICFSEDEQGLPMYSDPQHLRSSYMKEHATYLDKTILP